MNLIGKPLLHKFKQKYADSRSQIDSWIAYVEEASWKNPLDVKGWDPKASILKNGQVIFNICGDKYRLWVQIAFKTGSVLIKKIGIHKEYDKWNIN